jgi:uncharacterized membrane protein YeaQ/YmgE (transglycosylase-associated protein family)
MDIIYILIIGAVSGWLAGLFVKGNSYGLIGDIILGIVGSFVGGWLLGKLGVHPNLGSPTVNLIVTSVIGAAVILFIAGLVKSKQ